MATRTGNRLPDSITSFFDGAELGTKIGGAFILITVDDDGAPRPCMLSAGEVWAPDTSTLRLALWSGTHTSGNLGRGGTALLCFVSERTVAYVFGHPRRLAAPAERTLDCFEFVVDAVDTDEHAGMPVVSGILFDVPTRDRSAVVSSWQRQIEALRASA